MNHPTKISATLLLALALLTAGCVPLETKRSVTPGEHGDLDERISAVMRRNGYSHEVHSFRTAQGVDDDFISIHISLDALRRHNRVLEKMLREIGAVCQREEYAHIPVTFKFFTDDSDSGEYVEKILNQALGQRRSWILEQDSRQEGDRQSKLVIHLRHSWIKQPAASARQEE